MQRLDQLWHVLVSHAVKAKLAVCIATPSVKIPSLGHNQIMIVSSCSEFAPISSCMPLVKRLWLCDVGQGLTTPALPEAKLTKAIITKGENAPLVCYYQAVLSPSNDKTDWFIKRHTNQHRRILAHTLTLPKRALCRTAKCIDMASRRKN
jgi:hypothetical protein